MNGLYMIRAFGTGTGFGPQVWLLILALALAGGDGWRHRRGDYGWVLLAGTLTWTAVELTLQLSGMRIMPDRTLLGMSLPLLVSAPLQGAAEGGAIAVLGLFIGDGLLHRETRTAAIWRLLALCVLAVVPILLYGETMREVTSRRNILAVPSILFCFVLLGADAVFWMRWRALRRRVVAMLAALLAIGTSWTIAAFIAGGRWIEVTGSAPGTYARANLVWQALGLSYDVIIEFACAYVAFLALPAMLGVLSDDADASRCG